MKLTDYLYTAIICGFISIAAISIYDAVIITPKFEAKTVKVVDIDYILSSSEQGVRNRKISIETYKKRISYLEQAVSQNKYIVINKYLKLNNDSYPIVYGGDDLTDYFIKHIEAIE